MKKLSIITSIIFFSITGHAQINEITFKEMEHDFGSVKEEDGPVTHEFTFINNTQAPLKVLTVRASCGCTTPGWTKEEVAPGKSGFVKAQYNPYNRPGPFNKTLTVQTTSSQSIVLKIKGNVLPRLKTTTEQYPVVIGNLSFTTTSFNMEKVTPKTPVTREFEVLNSGTEPVEFIEAPNIPGHLKIMFLPRLVAAGETAKIVVIYDAKVKGDMGFLIDDIKLFTNESSDGEKAVKVYATIEPYIPPMTREEKALAPVLSIDKSIVDFGTITQGEKVENEYLLKNSGKSTLEIVMTKPSCECTTVSLSKNSIEPGEEVSLKVVFDSQKIKGTQQKYITIFSNDPSGPSKRVTLRGVVN